PRSPQSTLFHYTTLFRSISTIEKIDPTGRKLNSLQQFETTNLFTSFYITLFNVVAVNKMHIKICGNCGRYFITHKDTVTYCDRIDRKSTRLNSSHVSISY